MESKAATYVPYRRPKKTRLPSTIKSKLSPICLIIFYGGFGQSIRSSLNLFLHHMLFESFQISFSQHPENPLPPIGLAQIEVFDVRGQTGSVLEKKLTPWVLSLLQNEYCRMDDLLI